MFLQSLGLGIVDGYDAAYAGSLSATDAGRNEARDFIAVDKEIRDGLKNEKERMASAHENRMWYEGDIEAYLEAMAKTMDLRPETVRTVNIFKRIVKLATKYLYTPGPERNVEGDEKTTEYMRLVYDKAGTDRIMLLANRYAMVSGVCAVQVELNEPEDDAENDATLNLTRPAVRHRIWPADQFVVWTRPGRPEVPWCVGTLDYFDEQRRLRVWTERMLVTYVTEKFDRAKPWEGTAYTMLGKPEKNPFGFVPFAFVPWEDQVGKFWVKGPGDELQRANESVDYRLWKMNDDIHYQRSLLIGTNVRKDFRLPDRYRAGELIKVQPALVDAMGNSVDPTLGYLAPELGHLVNDREDLDYFVRMIAENQHVPESAYRLESNGATSGVAIVAEQLPLIEAAEERQTELTKPERDLYIVTLLAAGTYVEMGDAAMGQTLIAAAGKLELTVQWGNPTKSRPGEAFDQHQAFKDAHGYTSKVNAIAEILNISREQARKEYDRLCEERKFEKKTEAKYGLEPAPQANADGKLTEPGTVKTDAADQDSETEDKADKTDEPTDEVNDDAAG